jgi:hypothetical protein
MLLMNAGVTARFFVGSDVFVVVVVVDEVVVVVLTAEVEPQAASKRALASMTGPTRNVRFISTPQFAQWSQCNSITLRIVFREGHRARSIRALEKCVCRRGRGK